MAPGIRELCDELEDGFVSNYARNDLIIEPRYKGIEIVFVVLVSLFVTSYFY